MTDASDRAEPPDAARWCTELEKAAGGKHLVDAFLDGFSLKGGAYLVGEERIDAYQRGAAFRTGCDRQWQPIETAPRRVQASYLLGWTRYGVVVLSWDGRHWTSAGDDSLVSPTHWQPLPEPPE